MIRILATVVFVAALAGCVAIPDPAPTPSACDAVFSAVRCENMADYAASKLGRPREDIVGIVVQPEPTPEVRDGVKILITRSGGPPVDTLVTLRDGTVREVSMDCGGIPALQCR